MIAIAVAGEGFGAFVYPVAVFVVAVLRCYGWEGLGDAVVEGVWFGFFVAHGLSFVRSLSGVRFSVGKEREFGRSVQVYNSN